MIIISDPTTKSIFSSIALKNITELLVLEYFHFVQPFTSTPVHLRDRYCTSICLTTLVIGWVTKLPFFLPSLLWKLCKRGECECDKLQDKEFHRVLRKILLLLRLNKQFKKPLGLAEKCNGDKDDDNGAVFQSS